MSVIAYYYDHELCKTNHFDSRSVYSVLSFRNKPICIVLSYINGRFCIFNRK